MSTDFSDTQTTRTKTLPTQPIVARAGRYFRNMRYVIVALCIGMGGWFLYDGLVGYPKKNARIKEVKTLRDSAADEMERGKYSAELTRLGEPHPEGDLKNQKLIGGILPIVGLGLLGYWLHKSRGEYRLENNVLSVPGHPPVPISAIQSVDTSKWDTKGIARIEYKTSSGDEGSITLDDFVYDRKPIDDMYEVIVAGLKGA